MDGTPIQRKRITKYVSDLRRVDLFATQADVDMWEAAAKSAKCSRSTWIRNVCNAAANPCEHKGADLDLLPGPGTRLRCRRCGVVLEPRQLETGHGPTEV